MMVSFLRLPVIMLLTATILFGATGATAGTDSVIRVGLRSGIPPFCFFDESGNGSGFRGISIDIMQFLGNMMNVEIRYIDSSTISNRWDMLENNEIDAIVFAGVTASKRPNVAYIPVDMNVRRCIFVHDRCKTVVSLEDLADKSVGVLIGESYTSDYPVMGWVLFASSELEGLTRLNRGEFDAFVAPSEMVAEYLIQKHKLVHVLKVGRVLHSMPLAVAIRAQDMELYEKFADATSGMERLGDLQSIKEKWYGVTYPEIFWDKYIHFFLIGVGLALLVLCLVLFWNQQLKKQIRKVTLNLKISEQKSRELIESSPDMIFVIDSDGYIVNANKEARTQILGVPDNLHIPIKLQDLAVENHHKDVKRFIESIFVHSNGAHEFSFYDTSHGVRELSITASSIASELPLPVPVACFFARDVTERNRIERDLVQADRMAIMGQMAAGVAHEINNPLGIVRANLELIASRGWFAKDAVTFVDSIRRNIERAGKITKDLLEVTKPRKTVMTEVNLRNLLDMTLKMVGPQLKRVRIVRRINGDAPLVFGDRNLLQQVLVNIFLNAQSAMASSRDPSIVVSCCSNQEQATASIKILDNGTGIQKEFLARVFDPFFTHGKKEGFGLGLFISKRIITRHDGIIFAESEFGKGTDVIIELPLMSNPGETRTTE